MSAAVVLTRPAGQNEALAARLRARGRTVVVAPALTLAASDDAPLPALDRVDLVMFVSGNAARFFLDRLAREAPGAWPATLPAATVGPGSAAVVRAHPAYGGAPIVTPPTEAGQFDSEALWTCLRARRPAWRRVLIVRGQNGRDWLADRLRGSGTEVDIHCAYHRGPSVWDAETLAALRGLADAGRTAVWLVTSIEGADALATAAQAAGLARWWSAGRFVATHVRIAAHLESLLRAHGAMPVGGPAMMLQTCPPDDEAVFAAIESAA